MLSRVAQDAAAARIQAGYRGYKSRKERVGEASHQKVRAACILAGRRYLVEYNVQ